MRAVNLSRNQGGRTQHLFTIKLLINSFIGAYGDVPETLNIS